MSLSILLSPYMYEICGCSYKCEASLAKDCQGCLHSFYGVSMRLRVRHGILGETALTIEVSEQTTLVWDIMKQTARVLRLDSPFQVVLYADDSSVIQSPLRAVPLDTCTNEAILCYTVQSLQVPSAQQYQDLMTAIHHKDVMDVSYFLGKGLGLMDEATE